MRNIAYISIQLFFFVTVGAENPVTDQKLWYYKATGQAERAPSAGYGRSDTIVYSTLEHGASSWTLRPRVHVEEQRLPKGHRELRLVDAQGNAGPVVTLDLLRTTAPPPVLTNHAWPSGVHGNTVYFFTITTVNSPAVSTAPAATRSTTHLQPLMCDNGCRRSSVKSL